jgi:hypothetical protein
MDILPNSLVPDAGDLADIERDLRFFPASTERPTSLTSDQLAYYNVEGYLAPIRALSSDAAAELREFFNGVLTQTLADGGSSYSINGAHRRFPEVWDLMHNTAIVDAVADILGPNVVAWGAHFFCKLPHDGKIVDWHQDAVYWPMTPSKTVTVWLAIDDTDAGNACMRFIPQSHLHGTLMHTPSVAAEDNVLNLKVPDPLSFGSAPVDNCLLAGEFSLHSDLLLHGSKANTSDRRRCGITLRYCAADVRAYLGWHEKGMVVRGTDPGGHWGNPARP